MFRPTSRSVLRAAQSSLSPARTAPRRRFISTEPPHLRSRSWKSGGLRWGLAIAGIYYYNTSPVFAEQPQSNLLNPNLDALDESDDTLSLEALTSRRSRKPEKNAQALHSAIDTLSSENASTSISGDPLVPMGLDGQDVGELEEEADGEGAFNPETGEINWDCSCLGGMAHGPCGPEFREAFSCFVYSKEEPKGMDCIEKFQGMRDCFQQHPDVYKDELMEDEEMDRELEVQNQELAQQIAERQSVDAERSRRLLEEPAPEPRPAKGAQKQMAQPSTEVASSNLPESSSPKATPPDEKLSAKDDHQVLKEDHSIAPNGLPDDLSGEDVIPAAAHDARKAKS